MNRTVSIRNAHPKLRVPRAAVARAIAILDEHFRVLSGDRKFLHSPTFAGKTKRSEVNVLHFKTTHGLAPTPKSKSENPEAKISPACPPGELSLVFLTDPALAKIHAEFMDDPSSTDVITFEGDTAAGLAGEICVSADTALTYAKANGHDFAEELTLYLVHGWLHLAGYDDLQPAKKRRMRAAEARAMKLLRAAEAVPGFRMA